MKLIIACDKNGGIGYKNKLPWSHIQGDLPRFKSLTNGQKIVMGRNTWESLPIKPLPGRLNFVVSSSNLELPDGVTQIKSLSEVNDAWLIGGAQLINSSWDMISTIYLTRTFAEYTCDTFIDLAKIEDEFVQCETDYLGFSDHTYEIWKRK